MKKIDKIMEKLEELYICDSSRTGKILISEIMEDLKEVDEKYRELCSDYNDLLGK